MNPLLEILQPAWFYPITHTQDPVLSLPQKISVQCPAQKISVQFRIVAFSIVPFVPFLGDRLRTWDANSECRARGLTLGSAGWAWQAAPCLRLKNLFSCLSPGIFILNLTFFFSQFCHVWWCVALPDTASTVRSQDGQRQQGTLVALKPCHL